MSGKLKTIIVDNDKYSIDILESLLTEYFHEIQITEKFTDPIKAENWLKKNDCDLLLLDVQMPNMNGFELLESISPFDGNVIFVTSYDEFAVEAFRYHALHYLVKPVRLSELREAVKRLSTSSGLKTQSRIELYNNVSQLKGVINRIGIHTLQGLVFIEIQNIIRCEADGSYTTLVLEKEKHVSSRNLKYFESLLGGRGFYRIHASHLININHVRKITKGEGAYVLMNDSSHITISRRKKADFLKHFE
jgi:two-component system LytT family response regulator